MDPAPTLRATRASVPVPTAIIVTVLVDGGRIEAYFGEQLPITTLVQPSNASGAPDARYARPFNTAAGVTCGTTISRLASLVRAQ